MTDERALQRLRVRARRATLFGPTGLADAIHRLGFVQADPIQAPARAQDLILRHRVRGYKVGDLHRRFARLGLEEDFLYAYGFMPEETRNLLHPRLDPAEEAGVHRPTGLAADVLAFVRKRGPTHPKELEATFGRSRAVNDWGGFSKETTRVLERLRHYGLLRVARRVDGIRIYRAASPTHVPGADPSERARKAVLLVARLLAPVSAVSLRGALALMGRHNPGLGKLPAIVAAALRAGELESDVVDGETYLWPAAQDAADDAAVPRDVRLLSPFDPVVWDRRRFEHLWGWPYRFEAYTPPARRRLGYYAMPLLWGTAVIGWANVSLQDGTVRAALGFPGKPPRSQAFNRALEAELARMTRFLAPVSIPPELPG